MTIAERNAQVVRRLPMVDAIVRDCYPGAWRDDLIQVGRIGLIQAVERSSGDKFSRFASRRIHGAIKDYLRQQTGDERCMYIQRLEGESIEVPLTESLGRKSPDFSSFVANSVDVEDALGRLKSSHRYALVARFFGDLDYTDMAACRGDTASAEFGIVNAALTKLRTRLSPPAK